MGKIGREHVRRRFSWKKHCDVVERSLVQIANEKS
jgi:hypothetical protein